MSDVKEKNKGSMLRPLKTLKFLTQEPVTLPMQPRPAAENYRGFHVNDWDLCIGCGTCGEICDNKAIRMIHIPDLPSDPLRGIKPRRPAIDYGRCCWCALCVDICPTGSISLSREYIHISANLNSFFILPDAKGMHGLGFPKGWSKSADADLLDLQRQPMPMLESSERLASFAEVVEGYDEQTALFEASRCIQCGMCHDACPTHMHAPEYIRAIWSGDIEGAVEQIYRTNPLAHVCGSICTHRCETACSIGKRGDPIAIRWLKQYAMNALSHERIKQIAARNRATTPSGRRVAIIGSGPAGLTAAHDLALQGHAVTLFEALPEPGGMMRYGIPEYRLPYPRLDDDIDVIRSLGVDIRCNTRIGPDLPMEQLQSDYDAVLAATGLHLGRSTRIPDSDHPATISAIELLRRITMGAEFHVPHSAVVIGGGNVAMDAARSLARLQQQRHGQVNVIVTALEARDQLLADADEIRESEEEGIVILSGRGPRRCLVEDGVLKGLETVRCVSIFDEAGRFHPLYDENDVQTHAGETLVEAIGQAADTGYLGEELTEQLEWQHNRLQVDTDGRTSIEWLWAAGDLVEGPDVVHAIAAGHRVAASMQHYLNSLTRASA